MKTRHYVIIALAAGLLAVSGCGKSGEPKRGPLPPGAVDLSPLQQAFPNPPPEVTTSLDKLRFAVRYRTFDAALPELDKLSHLPNLTDPQKKAINDVTEEVKAAMKPPATPPQ
jgi:hypothetical protein